MTALLFGAVRAGAADDRDTARAAVPTIHLRVVRDASALDCPDAQALASLVNGRAGLVAVAADAGGPSGVIVDVVHVRLTRAEPRT